MRRATAWTALCLWVLLAVLGPAEGQTRQPPPKQNDEVRTRDAPVTFRANVNLVLVPVVVRDRTGRAVGGLRKEDFQLFDKGKLQTISSFSVETLTSQTAEPIKTEKAPAVKGADVPKRFVMYFFDDMHLELGDLKQVRAAAELHINQSLAPTDRAAIFTTSGRTTLDFTDDRAKLHETLLRLNPPPTARPMAQQCPNISYYQADSIIDQNDPSALQAATQDAMVCMNFDATDGVSWERAQAMARATASQVLDAGNSGSRISLHSLGDAVRRISAMPGQRSVIILSPGFLALAGLHRDETEVIDRAIRSNVVISALNARGLYANVSGGDAGQPPPQTATARLTQSQYLHAQDDVLAEFAYGTGGLFVHNDNNLVEGLKRVTVSPEFVYVLGFLPQEVKPDGEFHPLKVTLKTADRLDVQARRGYFANAALAEKDPARSEVENLVYSQDERQDLPATVTAQVEKPAGDAFTVSVKIHVDTRSLPFRKEADRSVDTLIFDTALFDRDGKYVEGKESSLDLRLTDAKLEQLLKSGIGAQTVFSVAPGTYRIREVVRDTESKKMSALNCNVEVTAPPVAAAPAEPAAPATPKTEKENKPMAEWTAAEFVKAMPELMGLEPAPNQDRLPILLAGVGQNLKLFFEAFPAATAHEQITLDRLDGVDYGREEFNYLDLPRSAKDPVGRDEFRTNAAGERSEPVPLEHGLVTQGFASSIVLFHPEYQPESTFSLLGSQSVNGHATDVLYFAQIPGKARLNQSLKADNRQLQILIQGLAWIDSGNNQIVRMRTELLEPQDDPDLKMQSTKLRFNAVHFKDVPQAFWLPEEVTVTLKWRAAVFRNRHEYSNFQLLPAETASVGTVPNDSPREALLLARFKQKIQQVLAQVPSYTCLETIQRSVRSRRANAFSPLDSVLLEVSTVSDKELLAWPGARRFEEADLSSFVNGGLIGSGVFASHARSVFLNDTTTIKYYGDEGLEGRTVARFDFRVPEGSSGYQIRTNGAAAKVGTAGSFWIDPASLELVRMEVRADEIPAALGIDRTVTVIDYAPMRIGDSDVRLPQAAKTLLVLPSGEVRRNDIQFSHCHEYHAESSIRFDMPDTLPAAQAPQRQTVDLPAGLTVSIELETAIDSTTAHIGDLLRGHVTNDVRRRGKTIIPKGAVATGRVRGLERLRSPGPVIDLTIEIAELEWENSTAQFYGELLPSGSERDSGDSLLNLPSMGGGVPDLPPAAGSSSEPVHAPQIPGTGVLQMTGTRFHLGAGLHMTWRTLEPNQRLKKPK